MLAYTTDMEQARLVVVKSYGNRAEAELAKGALEDAGVPAMTQADTAGGMREHLAWSGAGFQVLVREQDAIVARDVLIPGSENEADDKDDSHSRPTWRWFT